MYLFYTMANFQGIVLMITVGLFIVSLILIVVFLSYSKSEVVWPPLMSNCPDYWVDTAGNNVCVNVHKLGTGFPEPTDGKQFYSQDFTSMDECSKYKWANDHQVWWDGINYGYGKTDPCTPDEPEETA